MMSDFSIIVPSNRDHFVAEIIDCVKPYNIIHFDGNGYESFSKLMNNAIASCTTDICIICNDKSRPKPSDIDKMLNLIDEGYGMVQLYCFGFYGFKMDLIRQVGWFEERLIGEEREDSDYVRRMKLADIGYYEEYGIEYREIGSSWKNKPNRSNFYYQKWIETNEYDKKILPEQIYPYQIASKKEASFKKFKDSRLMVGSEGFRSKPIYNI